MTGSIWRSRAALVVASLCAIALDALLVGPGFIHSTLRDVGGDFPHFYVGARLVFTGELYNPARALEMQHDFGVDKRGLAPNRLPFYYALISPLGWPSYPVAHQIWTAMLVAAALAFLAIYPSPNRAALMVASAASLPLFVSVIGGQDVALLLLALAAGLRLRSDGRPAAAGMVLALLLIKFHLFLLLPVFFLARREFRLAGGMLSGGAALAVVSFLAAGGSWARDYLQTIFDPQRNQGPDVMPNLHGLAALLPHSAAIEIVLSVAVVAAVLAVARAARFELALAAAMLGGLLVSRHAYVSDCAVLIPALLSAVQLARSEAARVVALICLTPFPYLPAFLGTLGILLAALFSALLFALSLSERTVALPGRSPSPGLQPAVGNRQ